MKDGTFIEMSSRTMAFKPLLFRTLMFTLLASVTTATTFNLSSEITRFVPTCARQCFRSHLSANYALTTCGSAPTLQCLCANVGFSGLTIGEGAVQCLFAEKTIGSCRESDAPQMVIDAAYLMCSNKPGAVIPTHTAIIATLILPTSGAGVIVVPPPTIPPAIPPTSTIHLTSSIPTTLVTATGSPSIPSTFSTITTSNTMSTFVSSTTSTSLPPPPSSTPTASASATPIPGAEEANSDSSERLGTAQVAGLAVGIAAALGIAILAICLARRRRRRDYPEVKTGFFPVREKDSWEFHPQEGPANIFHISPPLHHARSPSPPPQRPPATYTRNGGRQNRPTSRLLPAKPSLSSPKPVLSLKIPRIVSPSPPQSRGEGGDYQQTNSQILNERTAKLTAPPRTHYNLPRESTMTEFEEDGAITSARSQRSNNIWRPPSATTGKTPQSATTYYVADKNGNWVLGDPKSATHMAQLAELDASGASAGGGATAKPSYAESAMLAAAATRTGIGHGAGSPVAPSVPRMPPAPGLLPPAEILPANLHQSYSSSVHSPATTRPNTTMQPPLPQANGSSHPVPSMSFSHPEPPRRRSNSLGRRGSSRSKPPAAVSAALSGPSASTGSSTSAAAGSAPKRSDSHDSQASVTTIASSAPSKAEPVVEQSSLSPVVESPASNASPTGRSPVSYPAIPGRTSSKAAGNALGLLAPPTRQFAALPPGQPSPTLGLMSAPPPRGGPHMASYDVPRKPVARLRPAPDPARVATGSPSLRLVTPSPPSDTEPRETSRPPQMKPLYPPPLQAQRPRLERGDPHPQAQTAQVQQPSPNPLRATTAGARKTKTANPPKNLSPNNPPLQNNPSPPAPQPPRPPRRTT
ncbi:Def1-like protein [Colletotrichum musicola]|uniref:Def1-like protein n=1 Tax=Colletotrichum musicola TaxID=2175873 RepID=A0A8H6NZ81_9PEZI|nr:Def1-like protein [Colletotrichum musicola]